MQYILSLNQTGARLVVHDPGEWPLVAEYGIDVRPDTFTLTAITQVRNIFWNKLGNDVLISVFVI